MSSPYALAHSWKASHPQRNLRRRSGSDGRRRSRYSCGGWLTSGGIESGVGGCLAGLTGRTGRADDAAAGMAEPPAGREALGAAAGREAPGATTGREVLGTTTGREATGATVAERGLAGALAGGGAGTGRGTGGRGGDSKDADWSAPDGEAGTAGEGAGTGAGTNERDEARPAYSR